MSDLPLRSLTADVAHELSNQLGCLVLLPDLLLDGLAPDSPMANDLRQIRRAAHRIDELTAHLSLLSMDIFEREPVGLNAAVRQALDNEHWTTLLTEIPGSAVELKLEEPLAPVQGSPEWVSIIAGILVRNALDAHPGHTMAVVTAIKNLSSDLDGWETVPAGEYARLSVADGGPMLTPDQRLKLFEPYFTHRMGRRSMSGLGLAVVRQLARRMGAFLDVRSDASGTTVEVYFPVLFSPLSVAGGGAADRVLVVDDREEQRQVIARILRGRGYRVSSVGGGEDTLSHLENVGADLVILDVSLRRDREGIDLHEWIRRRWPSLKILLISGHPREVYADVLGKVGDCPFLKKPFRAEELISAAGALLPPPARLP